MSDRIPLTVLTGFLGSGKTTILNHLVHQEAMSRALIIINEFGEVGLDHMLVTHSAEQGMVQMSSGCLCCTIRSDLVQTLKDVLWRFSIRGERLFDRVLVETTGLADPAPILQTLTAEASVVQKYRLDGVVTVVDGLHGLHNIAHHDEAMRQVVVADQCLLTKSDMASESDCIALAARLSELNPGVPVVPVNNGVVDPEVMQGLGLFDLQGKPSVVGQWLAAHDDHAAHQHSQDAHHAHDRNRHDQNIRAHSFRVNGSVDDDTLVQWFESMAVEIGDQLLRLKGILVSSNSDMPLVIHAVQHVMHPPVTLSEWPEGTRDSRLVFITRNVTRNTLQKFVSRLLPD